MKMQATAAGTSSLTPLGRNAGNAKPGSVVAAVLGKAAEDDDKKDDKDKDKKDTKSEDDKKDDKDKDKKDTKSEDDKNDDKDKDKNDDKKNKKSKAEDDDDKKDDKDASAEDDDDGDRAEYADPKKSAVRARERSRINAILSSDAGKAHPKAAMRLAFSPIPRAQVLAMLESIDLDKPAETTTTQSGTDNLRQRMSDNKVPLAGPNDQLKQDGVSDDASVLASKIIEAGKRRRGEIT